LLTLTRVDVNKPMDGGFTPFHITCLNGHKEVVSLLLADMRIDVNKPENDQCTPVWIASQSGYLPAVQLILASGREVNTMIKSRDGNDDCNNNEQLVLLLLSYILFLLLLLSYILFLLLLLLLFPSSACMNGVRPPATVIGECIRVQIVMATTSSMAFTLPYHVPSLCCS